MERYTLPHAQLITVLWKCHMTIRNAHYISFALPDHVVRPRYLVR